MPYGAIKVDNITFTNGGADQATTVSGIYRAITSGVTVTGTISGVTIQGTTVSGATVTGTTANFTSGNFVTLSGATATFTSGVIASGTAAAPSLSIASDPNTGIYSPGADQVALATAGTGRLFVDSTGRVGIGTSSPITALQVVGVSTFGNNVDGRLQVTTDSNLGYIDSLNNTSTQWQPLIERATDIRFCTNTAGVTPVEKVRIDSAGSLLVGTSTSAQPKVLILSNTGASNYQSDGLQVQVGATVNNPNSRGVVADFSAGNVSDPATTYGATINIGAISVGLYGVRIVPGNAFAISDYFPGGTYVGVGNPPAERLRINASGNVGIGTSAPAAKLHIQTIPAEINQSGSVIFGPNTNYGFEIRNVIDGAGFPRVELRAPVVGTGPMYFYAAGAKVFFDGGTTEVMRIDTSGNLLVGTSASRGGRSEFVSGTANTNADYSGSAASFVGAGLVGTATNRATITVEDNSAMALDVGGSIGFGGRYLTASTVYAQWAAIAGRKETGTSGEYGGYLGFYTRIHTLATINERMRITSTGDLLFQGTSTTNSAGFYAVPGETGTTPVKAFALTEVGKTSISYPGQWRILTSSGQGSVFKDGFYLHIRNFDAGTVTESGDLFQLRGNGGLANFSANDVNLSDSRAKKDIAPVVNFWDCVKQWEIVNYRYKEQLADSALNVGVIAQQVAESCPEVVTVFQEAREATGTDPGQEERLGVKEQQMMWMAIKSLQEAQIRIETLEAKVATLEGN
jgi:hypothetical protein